MKNTITPPDYDAILAFFCSTDSLRPHLNHPQQQGDFVYATDANHIIRIPRNILSKDYPNDCDIQFSVFWPGTNQMRPAPAQYDPNAIQDAILSIPEINEVEEEECDTCDGEGAIFCTHCCHSHDCAACDGKGYLLTGTTKKVFDPSYHIGFETASCNPRLLVNLLRVAEATGAPVYLLTLCDPYKMLLFQIGEIQVGIMPYVFTEKSIPVPPC